ncbi:MAG: ribosomal-processing cysteine protease Prp [Alkalispirochaeta sp.]
MIRIEVARRFGVPRGITSRGHAVRVHQRDSAPCAAVSTALQAYGLVITADEGCDVRGEIGNPGEFTLFCTRCSDERWYAGVAETVVQTLESARRSWPDEIEIVYRDEE